MTPAGSSRFASPVDGESEVRADPRVATLSPSSPVRPPASPSPCAFQLRCTDAHSPGCEHELRAHHLDELVALTREHGALRHGLTAIWYTPERLAKIATAVTRQVAKPAHARGGHDAGNYGPRRSSRADVAHEPTA